MRTMDKVGDLVEYLTYPGADARITDWPGMDWRTPAAITCAYIFGIPLGIAVMRNRAPMKAKTFSVLHNLVLFLLSAYMSVETVMQAYENFGWATEFRPFCNPVDPGPSFSRSGYRLARVLWIHYLSKAYEFVDTFIMILKKNNHQVSFLHVYHHATTFFPVWWANVLYGPGGEAWYCCFLNSLIHVFMYGYYLSASLGFRPGLLKPLMTLSQMLQFCTFIYQGTLHITTDCYQPRISSWLLLVQCAIFLALFTDFFLRAYVFKKAKKAEKVQHGHRTDAANGASGHKKQE